LKFARRNPSREREGESCFQQQSVLHRQEKRGILVYSGARMRRRTQGVKGGNKTVRVDKKGRNIKYKEENEHAHAYDKETPKGKGILQWLERKR